MSGPQVSASRALVDILWKGIFCVLMIGGLCLSQKALALVRVGPEAPYQTVSAALHAARPGEEIRISPGRYAETLRIDKPVTLRGEKGVVIAGSGRGSVITVLAAGTRIENLTVTGSGRSKDPFMIIVPAGIEVRADNVTIVNCRIEGNDTGIEVWPRTNVRIEGNFIHDNWSDGISVMGGRNVVIVRNRVENNHLAGITVDKVTKDIHEGSSLLASDRDSDEDYIAPEEILMADNLVHHNAMAGIRVNGSIRARIENNLVHHTLPTPDRIMNAWRRIPAATREALGLFEDVGGTGIVVLCDAKGNSVISNHVHDNAHAGILLHVTEDNRVCDNEVHDNRDGILLHIASDNEVCRNRVHDNRRYGIALLSLLKRPVPVTSGGNLMIANDLYDNAENARDETAANRRLAIRTLKQLETQIRRLTPAQRRMVKRAMQAQGSSWDEIQSQITRQLAPLKKAAAPNRWDDGRIGNRYDDFDEPREGFVDRNHDGIGEKPHPIPGGEAVDHHPLAMSAQGRAHLQQDKPFDPARLPSFTDMERAE